MPKQIIPITDESVISINANSFDTAKGFDDRSVLASHLGQCFFIRATATKVTKIVGFQKLRMFRRCTAVLLTTTGRIEQIIKVKSYQFEHFWLEDSGESPGEVYYALHLVDEYSRIDGSVGFGFRRMNCENPADLFEINFRLALGLFNIQLLLTKPQIPFQLDEETLTPYLKASIIALIESENLLESLYQTTRWSECYATRGILSLLSLWLEVLERVELPTKAKKAKVKRGFARC